VPGAASTPQARGPSRGRRCRLPACVAATDLSLRHDLPMANALIYAVALTRSATLVTADTHFPDIEGVEYIAREE